eukprot:11135865-Ditylum_brightwellii.AAC.1
MAAVRNNSSAIERGDFSSLLSTSTLLLSNQNNNKMGGPSTASQELLQKKLREMSVKSALLGVLHAPCGTGVPTAPSTSATVATYEVEASVHHLLVREGKGFDSTHLGCSMWECGTVLEEAFEIVIKREGGLKEKMSNGIIKSMKRSECR